MKLKNVLLLFSSLAVFFLLSLLYWGLTNHSGLSYNSLFRRVRSEHGLVAIVPRYGSVFEE